MNTYKLPAPPPAALLPVARREPERSESDRSATVSKAGPEPSARPDPEVVAQAKRRTFTADYKQPVHGELPNWPEMWRLAGLIRLPQCGTS